jgi:CNT family concentrative nucleoside transporter
VIDAAARGAGDGLKLALNVGAMLLAFLALIALANKLLGLACSPFLAAPLTMEQLLGWACAPIAWLMGVPWSDCDKIGELVGIKTVANEFVAYLTLKNQLGGGQLEHARSTVIAIYALCGFANLGSIAIQIGGISAIAPERRSDLAKLGLKAMIAGNLACFMTACVAGLLT